MLESGKKVLVGTFDADNVLDPGLVAGSVAVVDENNVAFAAATAKGIRFANVLQNENGDTSIEGTTTFELKNIVSGNIQVQAYAAPTLAKSTVDYTAVTATTLAAMFPGESRVRVALRVYFKNVYELKGRLTKTYEVIVPITAAGTYISAALAKMINLNIANGSEQRFTIADAAGVLTLTATEVKNGQYGLTGDLYEMFEFEVSSFATSLEGYPVTPISLGTYTNTPYNKGVGNWKEARDAERANLGFAGLQNLTEWPVVGPRLNVIPSKSYTKLVFSFDYLYLSADNLYKKTTANTVVIYDDATTSTLAALAAAIKTACPAVK
jgi:hypothetical protein